MGKIKGWVDNNLSKLMSRKLMVWAFATVFFACGVLDAESWTGISLGYVGIQGMSDLATSWKSAGKQ